MPRNRFKIEDIKPKYRSLYQDHGDFCISDQEGADCFGKPCACLVCRHVDGYCVDKSLDSPCNDCGGQDNDRADDFCDLSSEIEKDESSEGLEETLVK